MNLMDAVRSGKRFRKNRGSPWIERLQSGGQETFRTKFPGGNFSEFVFFPSDFELDTWELETIDEKEKELPLHDRAVAALEHFKAATELFKSVIDETLGGKKPVSHAQDFNIKPATAGPFLGSGGAGGTDPSIAARAMNSVVGESLPKEKK